MIFKQNNNSNFNNQKINTISNNLNLDSNIIRLLFSRRINSEEKIKDFLYPSEKDFFDPFLLNNMKSVLERINFHIANKSKITILGDYDTDGISASAIIYELLKEYGIICDVFLPNRVADGYGLSVDTIDKIYSQYHPDLIITVDCGIFAKKEVEYCKKLGIEIIVTDHHDIPDEIPNCLIINPKLLNQEYPFKELCGAGVALKIAQAMKGIEIESKYVVWASIATIADIVPLIDENRAIVYFGLKNQKLLPIGLKKLIKQLKLNEPLTSGDISFKLAPKINASGRMGDASTAFKLYIEENNEKINETIDILLKLNEKRLDGTNAIFEQVNSMLKNVNVSNLGCIFVYDDNWESGVLGIICSKLVDIYNKPVCVLTKVDNAYKGSLRSIPSINIFECLNSVKENLIQFGGHNQAAGVTVLPEKLIDFRNALNLHILNNYKKDDFVLTKFYDLDITKYQINYKFIKQLELLEPFGLKNEKPIFRINFNNSKISRLSKFPQHIKMQLNNIDFIGFNYGDYFCNLASNCNKSILFELELDNFSKSKPKLKGVIKALSFSSLNTSVKSEIVNAHYITQLKFINETDVNNNVKIRNISEIYNEINELTTKTSFGVLVIANSIESYLDFLKNNKTISNFELYRINNQSGENTLLFAPNITNDYSNYNNIFILDAPIHIGYVNKLCTYKNLVTLNNTKFNIKVIKNLETNRNNFALYHQAIKNAISKNIPYIDMLSYFEEVKKINHKKLNLVYNQFVFVLLTFEELDIIKIDENGIKFTGLTNQLNNSKIYNFIDLLLKSMKGSEKCKI